MYNCFRCLKNEKTLIFLGGIATAVIGTKILKHPCTRKTTVKTLAFTMNLCDEAKSSVQNMREEAEDIYTDARKPICEE